MNDRQVAETLHSEVPLVLIEAPAGFGKTFQGAEYAKDLLPSLSPGRLLILTHTNAACDVFSNHTRGFGSRVEIRTIDSLITRIATVYHDALGLPADVPIWAHQQGGDGFKKLAIKVADFLEHAKSVNAALSARYPYVICDEHQDSNEAQHQIILSIHRAGSFLRIFADPMQVIYESRKDNNEWDRRWAELQVTAGRYVELDTPHRWKNCSPELGDWIKKARNALKNGQCIDLREELPKDILIIRADNTAQKHGRYILPSDQRLPIDHFAEAAKELMVLTPINDTANGLRAFFNRRIPLWEGYAREALVDLILRCQDCSGSPTDVAELFIKFVQKVSCGFSNTAYGDIFRREIAEGCCIPKRRKPAKIQDIAKHILECPDHRGVAKAAEKLGKFIRTEEGFDAIKLDYWNEFKEIIHLADYEDACVGLADLNIRRTVFRLPFPSKVISTVHKAKGLEKENVLIVPCDRKLFGDSDYKRRLLYVALSRATKSLALVVPLDSPSPLFRV